MITIRRRSPRRVAHALERFRVWYGAWVGPFGEVFPVADEDHSGVASSIRGIDGTGKKRGCPYRFMYERGWARVYNEHVDYKTRPNMSITTSDRVDFDYLSKVVFHLYASGGFPLFEVSGAYRLDSQELDPMLSPQVVRGRIAQLRDGWLKCPESGRTITPMSDRYISYLKAERKKSRRNAQRAA